MNEIQLDLYKFGITSTNTKFTEHLNPEAFYRGMVRSLTTYICGEPQEPYIIYHFKSWWQHFKFTFFPSFLLKKFPVQYKNTILKVSTLYPKLKTKLPLEIMGPFVSILIDDKPQFRLLPDIEGMDMYEWNRKVEDLLFEKKLKDYKKCPCCHRAWFPWQE